ncbi:MAG: hypothetical protein ABJ327_25450 [Litoreibacter sp.]
MGIDQLQILSEVLDERQIKVAEAFRRARRLQQEGRFLSARRKYLELKGSDFQLSVEEEYELELAIKRVTEYAMREI